MFSMRKGVRPLLSHDSHRALESDNVLAGPLFEGV